MKFNKVSKNWLNCLFLGCLPHWYGISYLHSTACPVSAQHANSIFAGAAARQWWAARPGGNQWQLCRRRRGGAGLDRRNACLADYQHLEVLPLPYACTEAPTWRRICQGFISPNSSEGANTEVSKIPKTICTTPISSNPTEVLCIEKPDFGKVLWYGLYSPFHKALPKSDLYLSWILVRFY